MTLKDDLLSRFSGETAGSPLFLPDLTTWYKWHQARGTLPEPWRNRSLPQVASFLDVPAWLPVQLWKIETPHVDVTTVERTDERIITHQTAKGTLVARWKLGRDGDWWQIEYPVKSESDLDAAVELIESRTYVLDSSGLSNARAEVGSDGIVALTLPKRPYSELLHDFLGWSDGLLLLGETEVHKMLTLLESKLQRLVEQIAELPGEIVLSPDNLDAQFISPGAFERYLAGSYRRTSEVLHDNDKRLVVHVGGPIGRLLEALAATGLDALQGICGPPQSDASLSETRKIVGPEITLWGGIPQDVMLETYEWERFETAVAQAAAEAAGDPRMILGVADRVPVGAKLDRLEAISSLIGPTSPT